MKMSCYQNIFRITGPSWRESAGHWSGDFPKRPVMQCFDVFLPSFIKKPVRLPVIWNALTLINVIVRCLKRLTNSVGTSKPGQTRNKQNLHPWGPSVQESNVIQIELFTFIPLMLVTQSRLAWRGECDGI